MASTTSGSLLQPTLPGDRLCNGQIETRPAPAFDEAPGFDQTLGLWLYGNVSLLSRDDLRYVRRALASPHPSRKELEAIEKEAEVKVLQGHVLVTGIHNEAHRRAAIVPLRWGAPRIVVFSGGFVHHLGESLREEPFRQARLWRYQWDPKTDLAVSRRAPDKQATFGLHNPTVDRLIRRLVPGELQ